MTLNSCSSGFIFSNKVINLYILAISHSSVLEINLNLFFLTSQTVKFAPSPNESTETTQLLFSFLN